MASWVMFIITSINGSPDIVLSNVDRLKNSISNLNEYVKDSSHEIQVEI